MKRLIAALTLCACASSPTPVDERQVYLDALEHERRSSREQSAEAEAARCEELEEEWEVAVTEAYRAQAASAPTSEEEQEQLIQQDRVASLDVCAQRLERRPGVFEFVEVPCPTQRAGGEVRAFTVGVKPVPPECAKYRR